MSTLAPVLLTARGERQIVKAFRSRGAISGAAARRLQDLGLKDSQLLRHLITATIVRKAGPERYFLHEPTWVARDHMSWRTVKLLGLTMGLALLGAVIYLLLRGR
jgi:hypothetical protein